jgi:hypothetical protein
MFGYITPLLKQFSSSNIMAPIRLPMSPLQAETVGPLVDIYLASSGIIPGWPGNWGARSGQFSLAFQGLGRYR